MILKKDIKTLNSNFEEVMFQIDDLKILFNELNKLYDELSIKLNTNLINKSKNSQTSEISLNEIHDNSATKNTLGTIKINSEDLSDSTDEELLNSSITNLNPDEQFQIAFDLLRSQKFDQAKKSFRRIY